MCHTRGAGSLVAVYSVMLLVVIVIGSSRFAILGDGCEELVLETLDAVQQVGVRRFNVRVQSSLQAVLDSIQIGGRYLRGCCAASDRRCFLQMDREGAIRRHEREVLLLEQGSDRGFGPRVLGRTLLVQQYGVVEVVQQVMLVSDVCRKAAWHAIKRISRKITDEAPGHQRHRPSS